MSEIRLRVDEDFLPLLGGSPEEIERQVRGEIETGEWEAVN